ncbi:MAG: hypothetical protein ACREQ5_30425 [Candidatus Dormibacteria bacterium]
MSIHHLRALRVRGYPLGWTVVSLVVAAQSHRTPLTDPTKTAATVLIWSRIPFASA